MADKNLEKVRKPTTGKFTRLAVFLILGLILAEVARRQLTETDDNSLSDDRLTKASDRIDPAQRGIGEINTKTATSKAEGPVPKEEKKINFILSSGEAAAGAKVAFLVNESLTGPIFADDSGAIFFPKFTKAKPRIFAAARGGRVYEYESPTSRETNAVIKLRGKKSILGHVLIDGELASSGTRVYFSPKNRMSLSHSDIPKSISKIFGGWMAEGSLEAQTDRNGDFRIHIPDGNFGSLRLSHEFRIVDQSGKALRNLAIETKSEKTKVIIRAKRRPIFFGHLLGPKTNLPLDGISLQAQLDPNLGSIMNIRPDENGRFFILQKEGTKELHLQFLTNDNQRRTVLKRTFTGPFNLVHNLGTFSPIIPRPRTLAVIVLNFQGEPIQGAFATTDGGATSTSTDKNGVTSIEIQSDKDVSLWVSAPGHSVVHKILGIATNRVEVVLRTLKQRKVLIVDSNNKPCAKFRLDIITAKPKSWTYASGLEELFLLVGSTRSSLAVSEESMTRHFDVPKNGIITLPAEISSTSGDEMVLKGTFLETLTHVKTVKEGEFTKLIWLGMMNNTITGIVVDQNSDPLAEALLVATIDGSRVKKKALIERDGSFRIDIGAQTSVTVVNLNPKYTQLEKEISSNQSPVELRLVGARQVDIRILSDSGLQLAQGIRVFWPIGKTQATVNKDGTFHLGGVPVDDEITIEVEIVGRKFERKIPATLDQVEIEIPAVGSIALSWDIEELDPKKSMFVKLSNGKGWARKINLPPTKRRPIGTFLIPCVLPQRYAIELHFDNGDQKFRSGQLQVKANAKSNIAF